MAYQIKKNKNITEDLQLLNSDDTVAVTIHVEINPDDIAKKYRIAEVKLIDAQKLIKSNTENAAEAFEAFGNAVIEVFTVVFGEENTCRILEYFENNYTEMAVQCMPFITDVIKPAILKSVQSKREITANNYNLSRQQKRKLGIK